MERRRCEARFEVVLREANAAMKWEERELLSQAVRVRRRQAANLGISRFRHESGTNESLARSYSSRLFARRNEINSKHNSETVHSVSQIQGGKTASSRGSPGSVGGGAGSSSVGSLLS